MFLLATVHHPELLLCSKVSHVRKERVCAAFASKSLQRTRARPIHFRDELREFRDKVTLVADVIGFLFGVQISSDVHEGVDTDALGDEVLPWLIPCVL